MLANYGIAYVGIASHRLASTSPLPAPKFRASNISARDISKGVSGSKYVKLEGFSAVDITPVVGGSKQIFIEQ